jgi:tRNA A-37 threonylcarbamoyl transferase component Bud32
MDYKEFGTCLISAHPESRTMSGDYEGQRLWIKQSVPPKARIWHALQKFLAAVTDMPILRATVSPGRHESLAAEAHRLGIFAERGFHVPKVVGLYQDMMVMTCAGPQLRAWLDSTLDCNKRKQALTAAIETLADLHAKGFAHGRPYMRDMTWDGTKIGFLDLEEDPVKVMPLATAQARDVWIFLSAASRYARTPGNKAHYEQDLITELFNSYYSKADPAVIKELQSFTNLLSPLRRWLEHPWAWKKIGTDARQSVFVTSCLEKKLKDIRAQEL